MYLSRPHIERDANITKMRLDTFAAIDNIAKEAFNDISEHNAAEIKFVSFEDAIKELASMKKDQFV